MIAVLMLLILKSGTVSAWTVTFENPNPCALKGSLVEFRCSYNYSKQETVNKTTWHKGELKDGQWKRVELSDLPSFENRTEYLGDLQHNCSLAIHDVQENDTGYYYFRFDTYTIGWRSKKSVYLSVKELSARVYPDTVRAGDTVTLECTSCQLPIVWFKDGRRVAKTEFQAQIEDAGNYACAVEGQESALSDPVALDVQYPPLIVSVEISYSGHLKANSVDLICSSTANPPANYTWYKRTDSLSFTVQVGSGQVLSIPSVEASHTGLYLCQARNQLGENNSTEVLLTVDEALSVPVIFDDLYPPLNVSVEVSYSGHLTENSSVNLTCSSAANPLAKYTWYKRTDSLSSTVQVGSGQVLSIPSVEASHTGLYLCQARNQLGENNSTEVLLTVDETDINRFILLVGIGVKVIIILMLTLIIIIWAWRSVDKEENSNDYENIATELTEKMSI